MKRLAILIILALGLTCHGAIELKQSTAVTLRIGPFIDKTDGATAETALTIHDDHVKLSKNGGVFAAKNDATDCSHDADGWYSCALNATDTGTLGVLRLYVYDANCAYGVWETYTVVTANYWDSKYGSDKLEVDVTQLNGSATPVSNLNNVYNTAFSSAFDDTNDVWNTRLTAVSDSAGIVKASGSSNTIQTDDSGYVKLSGGTGTGQISLSSGAVTVGTNNDKTGYSLSSSQTFNLTGDITGNLSGSVGSVTGNIGGNVTGTIGGLTAAALADMFDTNSGTTFSASVPGSVVYEIANNAGGSSLTEAGIADAVLEELVTEHWNTVWSLGWVCRALMSKD